MNEVEQVLHVLRRSVPFELVTEELLRRIASLARVSRYSAGQTIYESGAAAEDVCVVMEGEVEHAFDPGRAAATQLVTTIGPGDIFGWAALLEDNSPTASRTRLARTVALREALVLAINARALIELLEETPIETRQQIMQRFASTLTRLYGFAGFINVHGKLVPAYIGGSELKAPIQMDTFAF
jgi:NitT/TauT family transport system permease protein